MNQGKIDKAKKTLNRLRFGENAINNSEYNLLMDIVTEGQHYKVDTRVDICVHKIRGGTHKGMPYCKAMKGICKCK